MSMPLSSSAGAVAGLVPAVMSSLLLVDGEVGAGHEAVRHAVLDDPLEDERPEQQCPGRGRGPVGLDATDGEAVGDGGQDQRADEHAREAATAAASVVIAVVTSPPRAAQSPEITKPSTL